MTTRPTADLLVRAGAIQSMDPAQNPTTALAVRDGTIVATAGPDEEREFLESWRGPDTVVVDHPGLTVLPAFVDTHNHLTLAARNLLGVPVSQARDIAQLVELIRQRATRTPAGQWIISAADWHELQLAERRLPTAAELDRATTDHPVLVQRGGHNGVLNSAGLRAAGIDRDTPDVEGGLIDRDGAGYPTGLLQDAALALAQRVLPPLPDEALIPAIDQTSRTYAAHGIGTVRDPFVTPAEWHTSVRAQAAGRLSVRSHVMIATPPAAVETAGSMDAYLDALEAQGLKPGAGEGRLRLWGPEVRPRRGCRGRRTR
jgi:predicted amidohydrolase YtcJ